MSINCSSPAPAPRPGTRAWESYGWSNEAVYRPNTLITDPERTLRVRAGRVRLQGTAFAGEDPVVRVEVRIDGGAWQEAEITYAPGAHIWTLWRFDWDAEPGQRAVQVRCTTESGAMSLDDPDGTEPRSGYNGSMEMEVEVV